MSVRRAGSGRPQAAWLAIASLALLAACGSSPATGGQPPARTALPPSSAMPPLTVAPSTAPPPIAPGTEPRPTAPSSPIAGNSFAGRWQSVAQSTRQLSNQLYLELDVAGDGQFTGGWSVYACDSPSVPTNCRRREPTVSASGALLADGSGWLDLLTGEGPIELHAELPATSVLALTLLKDPFASSPGRLRNAELLRVLPDGSLATPGLRAAATLDPAAGPTLPPGLPALLPLPRSYRVWAWTEYQGRYNIELQAAGTVDAWATIEDRMRERGLDVTVIDDQRDQAFPSLTWWVDGGTWSGTIHIKLSELDPDGFVRLIYVFDVHQ